MNTVSTKWVLGQKVTMHPSSGDFDLVICETPAGAQGPPPHIHTNYKEAFLIVEGEMEFFVNGNLETRKAGESLDVPPGTLHTFNNRTDQPCKWVNIHSPKGFSSFFDTFGIPESERDAVKKSLDPNIIGQVLATASEYDMLIPPPPKE